MIEKLPLKLIPEEYKMEYLRLHKDLIKIQDELKQYASKSKVEAGEIKHQLKEYNKIFTKILELNEKFSKINIRNS